jgi:hypothetical protein
MVMAIFGCLRNVGLYGKRDGAKSQFSRATSNLFGEYDTLTSPLSETQNVHHSATFEHRHNGLKHHRHAAGRRFKIPPAKRSIPDRDSSVSHPPW